MDACCVARPACSVSGPQVLSACSKCGDDGSDEEGGPWSKRPRSGKQVGCRKPLLRDAKISPTIGSGMTALMVAAQAGSLENVKRLLGEGSDVNAVDPVIKWSALHWAAKERHAGICAELLRSGADIALANVDGKTPVQVAAEQDAEFAKKLETMGKENQMAEVGNLFF